MRAYFPERMSALIGKALLIGIVLVFYLLLNHLYAKQIVPVVEYMEMLVRNLKLAELLLAAKHSQTTQCHQGSQHAGRFRYCEQLNVSNLIFNVVPSILAPVVCPPLLPT